MLRSSLFRVLLLAVSVCFISATLLVAAESEAEGIWLGRVAIGGQEIRIVFKIVVGADGSLKASMDSPDQGATGIPVDSVRFSDSHLELVLNALDGRYVGELNPAADTIYGELFQGGWSSELALTRVEEAPPPTGPQPGKELPSCSNLELIGAWEGALDVSGAKLRIVFHVTAGDSNTLTATMDSPDQGAYALPVSEVACDEEMVRFAVGIIPALYEGELSEDGQRLTGEWKQGGGALPLELELGEDTLILNRPQEPQPPFPYAEDEVSYENREAGITLAGTLTYPETGGPYPAVLLISGSGLQDRNEAIMGHKPFLVLADYLTRLGIAVLRVDDRGIGGSTGGHSMPTSEDFAGDVITGVKYLKSRPEIDSLRIGLIGHSEGGIIAPMVASRSEDIAFIVLLAGTGVPGDEILYKQGAEILVAEGLDEKTQAVQRETQERIFAILREEKDDRRATRLVESLLIEQIEKLDTNEAAAMGDSQAAAEIQAKQAVSPWMRFFIDYDPAPALSKVKCPVLALIGEKDLQVDADQNLPTIEAALKSGGNRNYTVKALPGLNHLFQTAETGSPSEYATIEETMAPDVLKLVGDWILQICQQ